MNFMKVICVLMALAYVAWQLRQYLLGNASQRWRPTKGKVLRVSADEHVSHDKYGATHYSYSANVEYSYQVGTRSFESRQFTYEPTEGLSEDAVTQLLDGITEGAEVDVYYDPLHWERAVIVPGTSTGNVARLVFSGVVFVFVTWLCLFHDFDTPH